MNKHKLLALLALQLALVQGVMAQEGNANYPAYGFLSNWKLGGEAIYNHQYANGGFLDWRHATDAGFGIVVEKELHYAWDVRLHVAVLGLFSDETKAADGSFYDRYGKLTADVKFSINDAIMGYDPQRRFSLYALAGAGPAFRYRIESFGNQAVMWQGGLGMSYDFGQHGSVYAEYVVDNIADIPQLGHLHDLHGSLAVGLMYRFGTTKADRERIARDAELTQDKFDVLKAQVSELNEALGQAQQDALQLSKQVSQLEQQVKEGGAVAVVADNDETELDAAFSGIDGDDVVMRAMPFSVLFATDSYEIGDKQMEKIEAVAQVMKENPEIQLSVVGYCDYTASDEYNQRLSERRAEAVKNQLVRLGVPESRLSDCGKGKTKAFGDIKSGVNRRVSFYRIVSGTTPQ